MYSSMMACRVFTLPLGYFNKKTLPRLPFQLCQTPSIQHATDLYGIYNDSILFRQPPPRSAHRFCPNLQSLNTAASQPMLYRFCPNLQSDNTAASQPMLGMLPDRSCSSPHRRLIRFRFMDNYVLRHTMRPVVHDDDDQVEGLFNIFHRLTSWQSNSENTSLTPFQLRQTPSIQHATGLYGIYDDNTF